MKKIVPLILAAMMVLAMAVFSVGQGKEGNMEGGKAVFEEFCGKCHELERPLKSAKDRAGWERNVNRMSKYHKRFGGPIPEEARGAIVDYLTEIAGK